MAVFASLNPSNQPSIDLADFSSLSLHTAVLALRRLEHFRSWIFERFGRTRDVFAHVFDALDASRLKTLTCRAFTEGAQSLGYPCGEEAISSIFSLLDRNFDGNVSSRDFQRLCDLDAENLVRSLGVLRKLATDKFGGVDACFDALLQNERLLRDQGSAPAVVSLAAFQKMCAQAGFSSLAPNSDLKMVFLFLDTASGRRGNGFLNRNEWSLLSGFTSTAITGNPARLRRILEEHYGDLDAAFQEMHTSWLKSALADGLKQAALAGLARALCSGRNAMEGRRSPGSRRATRRQCGIPSLRESSSAPFLNQCASRRPRPFPAPAWQL